MASTLNGMEKRMKTTKTNHKASKTIAVLALITAASLLTGCSGTPSNEDIQQAIAEKYSMSAVPKAVNCTLVNTDKTGRGEKRWNFTCDASYDFGHRTLHLGAWRQDGKVSVFIKN
jgi:hypothetical protein